MKKYNLITLMLLFGFVNHVKAQGVKDSLMYQDLLNRVKKIEEYRLLDDKNFENKSKELDLKIEEYRQQKTILDWIAVSMGGLTIISLWGFWQKAKSIATKKIEKKFNTLLNDKKQQLLNIIESHDKENKLKNENTIYIVASDNSDTKFVNDFFRKLGFSKTIIKKVSHYEEIEKQTKYDILFLYREESNNPLSDDICKSYIENSRSDSIVFIFGKHIDLQNVKARSSSATFWSQLYGNLISALKYQEIID